MATQGRILLLMITLCSVKGLIESYMPKISLPEETFLSTSELIQYWGYPVETHHVRTDDGYFLGVHRIPHGKEENGNFKGNQSKPVMLLIPGLLCDSTIFVQNLPHQSLGYVLADAGYDVWIGNTRGTTHSKKHQIYSVDSPEFWDFSWDDMGKYDLPALVNYILENTRQPHLYYVGFSQGNLIGFSGLSENIELQKKIRKFFALAPITRLGGSGHSHLLVNSVPLIKRILAKLSIYQYMPHNQATEFLAEVICPLDLVFCSHFLGNAGSKENVNLTRVPLYLMHFPAGTSVKNMEHFAQAVISGEFKKFDHGWLGNLVWYGSLHAPSYDLRKLLVPTVLLSGSKDTVSRPDDVKWAASQLPHVQRAVIEGYGHMDFASGLDAREKVYEILIKMAD